MKKRIIYIVLLCCILCYNNMIKINASGDGVRVYTKEELENTQNNDGMPYVSLNSVQPRMIITVSAAPGLSIKGNVATCSAVVVGLPDKVKKIKIVIHLQQQDSYGNYFDIAKWETTNEGTVHGIEKYHPLSSRGIYRVQADAYVYDHYNNCELNFFYSYEEPY